MNRNKHQPDIINNSPLIMPVTQESQNQTVSKTNSENPPETLVLNIDEILEDIVRPCGLWQWSLTVLLLISSSSIATFDVFANSASAHRCRMEDAIEQQFDVLNLSFAQTASIIGPWPSTDNGQFISNSGAYGCFRYARQFSVNVSVQQIQNLTLHTQTTNHTLEACPLGYVHQPSPHHYPQSVVREFEIVCHKSWLVPLGSCMFIVGMMFGFISGGLCGDWFGRKKTLLLFTIIECVAALATSLSPNFITFVLGRALMGLGNTGKVNVEHVLLLELTVPRYRSAFGAIVSLGTNFLYRALLALWAYYVPNWRWLNMITMAPNLISVLYICLLPESPRWLNSRGRYSEALEVMKTGYRVNHMCFGKKHDSNRLDEMTQRLNQLKPLTNAKQHGRTANFSFMIKIFSSRTLVKSLILSSLLVAGISMCFLGILFYARALWNFVYLTTFINSTTAIPSMILSILLYRYFKRRKRPLFGTILVASGVLIISSLYTIIGRPKTDIVLTICSNIALILINASTSMCFVYIPELFPSEMRTHGFGLALGLGRLGSMFCPFVNELDKFVMHGTPLAIYGLILALELFVLWALQDTQGRNLADNLKRSVQQPVTRL